MPDDYPPTPNHHPTNDDTLHFTSTIDAVADRIKKNKNNKHGFTVGIFGDWGTGKSSFLLQLETRLKKDKEHKFTYVHFQAWRFHRADDPEIALVNTMFAEKYTLLKRTWDYIDRKIGALKRGTKVTGEVSMGAQGGPPSAKFGLEGDGSKAAEAEDAIRDQQEKRRHGTMIEERFFLYEAIRHTFRKQKQKPCVVFVDDLDRCMDEEAIFILEAMKTVFDVPNCIFVIAADRRKITKAIEKRRSKADADAYFRKFINLPVSMPRVKMDARFLKKFLDAQLAHTWRRKNVAASERAHK